MLVAGPFPACTKKLGREAACQFRCSSAASLPQGFAFLRAHQDDMDEAELTK